MTTRDDGGPAPITTPEELWAFVQAIPDDELDMHRYLESDDGPCCVRDHLERVFKTPGAGWRWLYSGLLPFLPEAVIDHLTAENREHHYPHPRGAPAKAEFKRRLEQCIGRELRP